MSERLAELVLHESYWLPAAMTLAIVATSAFVWRRRSHLSPQLVILSAMNLFYGCTIGVMSLGHLLAVSVKADQGTLQGSPWFLYPLGLALAIPSWWLALRAERFVREDERWKPLALNGWIGLGLVALGLHHVPLALPASLNVAYQLHSKRAVGWTIVSVTLAMNLALFIGSLIFMASGLTFEEFSRKY